MEIGIGTLKVVVVECRGFPSLMEFGSLGKMNNVVRGHIRWMIRRDMPEVMAIENASYDEPWTEEEMLGHLRRRNCIGMVVEVGEVVAGFMVYELHKDRINLLNFAIHMDYRRKRLGTQMLNKLIAKLSANRRNRITLTVCETNLAAQLFFKGGGFHATEVIRGDVGERDTYRMEHVYPDAIEEEFNEKVGAAEEESG